MAVTLARKGVPVVTGTDCGNPFLVPGFSLHDELTLLVEAGVSPVEALASATLNPARFLGREADFGTVEPGKIVGLVLPKRDPLADIRNTREIEAVVLGGQVFDRGALDRMLAQVDVAAR